MYIAKNGTPPCFFNIDGEGIYIYNKSLSWLINNLSNCRNHPNFPEEGGSMTSTQEILDFGHEKKCSSCEIHDETSLSSQTFAKKLLGNLQFQKIGWKISPIGFNSNFIPRNNDWNCSASIHLGGGFKYFLFLTLAWGDDPIWLIFFKWVETTT